MNDVVVVSCCRHINPNNASMLTEKINAAFGFIVEDMDLLSRLHNAKRKVYDELGASPQQPKRPPRRPRASSIERARASSTELARASSTERGVGLDYHDDEGYGSDASANDATTHSERMYSNIWHLQRMREIVENEEKLQSLGTWQITCSGCGCINPSGSADLDGAYWCTKCWVEHLEPMYVRGSGSSNLYDLSCILSPCI